MPSQGLQSMPDCTTAADPSSPRQVALDEFRIEEACQAREQIDPEVVDDYAELYRAEAELPPIECFDVDDALVVVDGFHRVTAAEKAGVGWLRCTVVGQGSIDDAIWRATGANQAHGLRRSNADKRKAVRLALESKAGVGKSDRAIAEHTGVDHKTVARVRAEAEASWGNSPPETREGKDGKTYPVKPKDPAPNSDTETPISERSDYDSDQWFTPPEYIEAVREVFGGKIDLDPCSHPIAQQVVQARRYLTAEDDGLAHDYDADNVFQNSPYSQPLGGQFVEKLCSEFEAGRFREAILLQNFMAASGWFHRLLGCASAICFPRKRIGFLRPDGSKHSGNQYTQIFAYLGKDPTRFVEVFGALGSICFPQAGELVPAIQATTDPSSDVAGAVKSLRRQIRERFGESQAVDRHLEAAWRTADDLIPVDCKICDGGGCGDCTRGRTTKGQARRAKEKTRSGAVAKEATS